MQSPTVPFLSDAQIDAAARDLTARFVQWKGSAVAPPIPVEDMVEKYLGVTLETFDLKAEFGGRDVLGAAYFNRRLIRVEEELLTKEGRFSFTVGHETGHWWLHRPIYEADKVTKPLFPGSEAPADIVCRSTGRKPRAEWQADAFASRLLMPERFVRLAFRSAAGPDPVVIEGLDRQPSDWAVLSRWRDVAAAVLSAGAFTNVSNEAMRYRLQDLRLVCASAAAIRSLF